MSETTRQLRFFARRGGEACDDVVMARLCSGYHYDKNPSITVLELPFLGPSSVLEDETVLSRLDRHLYRVESVLALSGEPAVFASMRLAVTSVGGRNFLNHPVPGYVDWIEQAMPLIAFIGISYCQRPGGHIRMDMFVGRLDGRACGLDRVRDRRFRGGIRDLGRDIGGLRPYRDSGNARNRIRQAPSPPARSRPPARSLHSYRPRRSW